MQANPINKKERKKERKSLRKDKRTSDELVVVENPGVEKLAHGHDDSVWWWWSLQRGRRRWKAREGPGHARSQHRPWER